MSPWVAKTKTKSKKISKEVTRCDSSVTAGNPLSLDSQAGCGS
jgi:hypothetical protein